MTAFDALDYAKVVSGVVTSLAVLDTQNATTVTAEPRLNLDEALESHHMLVVGAPLSGGQLSVALSSLLLGQLKQRLYERFSGNTVRPCS